MAARRLAHLEDRALTRLVGTDVRDFLQGLVTNDITRLSPTTPLYAALLTPQGKYLFDFILYERPGEILLDVNADRSDELEKRLLMYRLRAAVQIERARDMTVLAAFGPGELILPEGFEAFTDPRLDALGARLLGAASAIPADLAAWAEYDRHRIELGLPDGSRDMEVGRSTVLECNLEELNGVSFEKGCYVGQELTARTKHRGLLKRRLVPVELIGPTPSAGTAAMLDGREVGQLRSVAGNLGIAHMRLDALDAASRGEVAVSEAEMRPRSVDWLRSS